MRKSKKSGTISAGFAHPMKIAVRNGDGSGHYFVLDGFITDFDFGTLKQKAAKRKKASKRG